MLEVEFSLLTPEAEFKIQNFDKALHDRSAFSCGIDGIDRWLKSSMSERISSGRLRLWCATKNGVLVGFYALNPHSITPQDAGVLAKKDERHELPTLYLPCIAVSTEHQRQGIGEALMGHAIRTSIEVAQKIAVMAILLDVHIDENYDRRMAFYVKLGFRPLGGDKKERVFLPIRDAEASLKMAEKMVQTAS